jgi:iron(III) transport system ATP-binding protein
MTNRPIDPGVTPREERERMNLAIDDPRVLSGRDAGPTPALELTGVRKFFTRRNGVKVPAVDGVDLSVEQGEFVVLLGPSGCGKTTLLRCIAGLESPDEGTIRINGTEHFNGSSTLETTPDRRGLGMIFQSYALWPHMRVFTNVAYPLQLRKRPKSEIRERVREVLETVGIGDLADQYPGQLSGGQQQRVALARALVSSNGLILFDEPLSNVDAKVREQLRYEILQMQERIGFAAIYVTHDQEEAMELADRVAVLDSGKVAQLAPPRDIYETPSNRYVAKFIGAANEITGTVTSVAGVDSATRTGVVHTAAGPIEGTVAEADLSIGDEVSVIVRPELCEVSPRGTAGPNEWFASAHTTMFMGSSQTAVVRAEGWGDVRVRVPLGGYLPEPDALLSLRVPVSGTRIYRR